MKLVRDLDQLIENSAKFDSYRLSTRSAEQTFYKDRVRLGKMFLHIKTSDRSLFCPSRFVGYENNSIQKHLAFDEKTGTRTNQVINSILGRHDVESNSEKDFLSHCVKHAIEPANKQREYWIVNFDGTLPEKLHSHDIESDHPTELTSYIEGRSYKISVNKYERDRSARSKCIEHYGCVCAVCDFSFEDIYGSVGNDFIHVHHLVPIATIGKEYKLDPVNDLIPVCPNCHAMLHKSDPPFSIEELHSLIDKNKR